MNIGDEGGLVVSPYEQGWSSKEEEEDVVDVSVCAPGIKAPRHQTVFSSVAPHSRRSSIFIWAFIQFLSISCSCCCFPCKNSSFCYFCMSIKASIISLTSIFIFLFLFLLSSEGIWQHVPCHQCVTDLMWVMGLSKQSKINTVSTNVNLHSSYYSQAKSTYVQILNNWASEKLYIAK